MLLTVKEVASQLRVTARTVYKLAKEGAIPYSRVGLFFRFRQEDIDRYLASSRSGQENQNGSVAQQSTL